MLMYDIKKMKEEKEKQLNRRKKIKKVLDVLSNQLVIMKIIAIFYLIFGQPFLLGLYAGKIYEETCIKILSMIFAIVLFLNKSDYEE